ncbi:hypothetical protein RSOLAG1IB_01060 [Rhizoctonia solani AG-1 IB]|uniref:Uncharacterized protein n=1 Tax=Thanatephorus cucumeris (strain AG1-IB / isolate 7/3/14) TaxID=1108050 RepID=A0A0B7FFU0_THACB|nr:hypothetical protein RSOLAG1IB_01060 [Rhizoctonia solani AG-1 IB]
METSSCSRCESSRMTRPMSSLNTPPMRLEILKRTANYQIQSKSTKPIPLARKMENAHLSLETRVKSMWMTSDIDLYSTCGPAFLFSCAITYVNAILYCD